MNRHALRSAAALAVAVSAAVGCTSEPAERVALAPITAVLEAFDPERGSADAAFAQLNMLVLEEPDLAARSATALVDHPREVTRFGAAYVLGLTASEPKDVAALRTALLDEARSVRLLAAGALIGLGELDAVPVLIASVDSSTEMPYSGVRYADLAQEALEAYTGEELEGGAAWSAWWERSALELRWDPERERFVP